MDNAIISPEEVRQIVVEKFYGEFGFPTTIPAGLENVKYSEGVDNILMDVPSDPNTPGADGGKT